MNLPWCKCEKCSFARMVHCLRHHACCWMWKVALIVPFLHIVLHFCGIPHPEFLSFIP